MAVERETWICGGTVLTMERESALFEDGALGIRAGKICFAGPRSQAVIPPDAERIDASRCLVLPGLVNGHTHTGMSLLRGIADDLPLDRWLNEAIFPLERKWVSPEFVYVGTLLACAEMIRSGTVAFNDMYYLEEIAAKAAHEAGLRMVAGQTLVEASGVSDLSSFFEKFDGFIEEIRKYPLAVPAITPHSIYGLSLEGWKKTIRFAEERDLRLHFHLSETDQEDQQCIEKYGKSPVEVFADLGLWDLPRVTAAHATCLTEKDIERLSGTSVGVAHNAESNLKLGTRICPVVDLRAAGIPVSLGTDGVASNNNLDMLQEADTAAKLQVLRYGMGKIRSFETVSMLTREGAKATHLGEVTGTLTVGRPADCIVVDVSKPHAIPIYNPYSHLVYSASGADVRDVIVAGRTLMRDRKILSFDESAALEAARQFGHRIAKTYT